MDIGQSDVLDELVEEWTSQIPDLDSSPMLVIGRIFRIASFLDSQISRELKPFNLLYTDFDLLATLRRKGEPYELTPTQLSLSVILTSGAMTEAIGRLEKASLVRRTVDKADGRSRRVKLTAKGIRVVEKAVSHRFDVAEENLACLSKSERKQLGLLLKKMLLQIES